MKDKTGGRKMIVEFTCKQKVCEPPLIIMSTDVRKQDLQDVLMNCVICKDCVITELPQPKGK